MKPFLKDLAGGIALMIVAAAIGIGVNAARPHGLPLIQKGEAVATAHAVADEHGNQDTTSTAKPAAKGAISIEEMKRQFDGKTAVILDARSPEEYEAGHIPGAINIPHDEIPKYQDVLTKEVSNDAHVICYCRGPDCDFSDLLATELKIIGWEDVSVFSGGWEGWTKAGYPVEKGPRQ
jgi:3-mercaptopyruvate sulfurtransferase SseA